MGAGGGDKPPSASSFWAGFCRPKELAGQKKRGVRRAGPRSDAYVSGRDTSLTPQKGLRPPAATSGAPLQPPLAALEDASTGPCNGGACGLAAHHPEPGKDWQSFAPTGPVRCDLGLRHDRPTCRNGSSGSAPAARRTAEPLAPCGASGSRPPRPGWPCAGTPAFRPMHPFRRRSPPGLNDAPPKGWRSFRRCCNPLSATADFLRSRCPPGPCGRCGEPAVLRTSRTV